MTRKIPAEPVRGTKLHDPVRSMLIGALLGVAVLLLFAIVLMLGGIP